MNIYVSIKKLVTYGINCGLLDERDKTYTINLLIDALGIDSFEEPALETENINLEQTLNEILEYAVQNGLCEDSVN